MSENEFLEDDLGEERWILCHKCGKENHWRRASGLTELNCWNCNIVIAIEKDDNEDKKKKTLFIKGFLNDELTTKRRETAAFKKSMRSFKLDAVKLEQKEQEHDTSIMKMFDGFIEDLSEQLTAMQDVLRFVTQINDKAKHCTVSKEDQCPVVKEFEKLRDAVVKTLGRKS